MNKKKNFPDRMHPDDPKFADWVQHMMDQDDESVVFAESDDELSDDGNVEEIVEYSSDEDYSENEDSCSESSESEAEELQTVKNNFYFGKNKFMW